MIDLTNIMNQIEQIRQSSLHVSSRKNYNNCNSKFISFIAQNNEELLSDNLRRALNECRRDLVQKEIQIKAVIEKKIFSPIQFENLTPEHFFSFLLSLKKSNNNNPGIGVYKGHRSALKHLYREFGFHQSNDFELNLANLFKGLEKMKAKERGQGVGNVREGKQPLSLKLYEFLSKEMLIHVDKEFIFGRCFLTLCWNLMCRAGSMANVKYQHMEWQDDSMKVYFAHQKNDQCGERSKDPRHIYANPSNPLLCPILALGMYWLKFGFDSAENSLFGGSNQYERFRKVLLKLWKVEDVKLEAENLGIDSSDYGTHSIRKGSATYCANGSTGGMYL